MFFTKDHLKVFPEEENEDWCDKDWVFKVFFSVFMEQKKRKFALGGRKALGRGGGTPTHLI